MAKKPIDKEKLLAVAQNVLHALVVRHTSDISKAQNINTLIDKSFELAEALLNHPKATE